MTTTLIPLNICPTEYSRSINQKCIESSEKRIIIHEIGDWTIRESLEPFHRKENDSLPSNVKQWSVRRTRSERFRRITTIIDLDR